MRSLQLAIGGAHVGFHDLGVVRNFFVGPFGQHGTNELIYLVGLYALVSTTLNGFNVPVPERD